MNTKPTNQNEKVEEPKTEDVAELKKVDIEIIKYKVSYTRNILRGKA